MRLSAGDVAELPLACALFDRRGRLLHATPEWQGFSLGALTYDAGVGSLVVVPDGCSPDVDGLVTDLIAEVAAAGPGLARADRMSVDMLASALGLVAGRGPSQSAPGTVADVVEYVREGVRRTVPSATLEVEVKVEAEIASPAALALALVQLVRNAARHAAVEVIALRVGRGPTFSVDWRDPDSQGARATTSRRPDQRPRWGLGFARLVADSLGGVVTSPSARGDGVVAASIGLGVPRLAAPLATAVRGSVERATRAWDEETGLPPGSALDTRAHAAVAAASVAPGEIGYADILRARATDARTWLAVAPQSSLGRARDVLRGMQHENALLTASEPHATRIFALASALACAVSQVSPEAVPDTTWARDLGPACAALGIPVPAVGRDLLRYPEPRLTAYLLATLSGRLVEQGSQLLVVAAPGSASHPLVRLLGGRDGAVTLVS
ncbi:MAG: hypothetical protein M3010_02620 [Candidatus Dormibacteraeota bacterium]|nr:hypothetical protein [Candidatus Dormibacteraeota bacterium]